MRVIAGVYRSRLLSAPRGTATRPTSDRLRETLFNVIAPRLPGARFADLYAGSGAVGIEALSRGAAYVYFAEKAPAAVAAIRANLAMLKVAQGFAIEERGVGALLNGWIERSAKGTLSPLDVIVLDPPWESATEYTATLALLGSARGSALLAPGAAVVAEHSARVPLPERFGSLVQTRTKKQGDAALAFYSVAQNL